MREDLLQAGVSRLDTLGSKLTACHSNIYLSHSHVSNRMAHASLPPVDEPAPPVKRRRGRQPRPSLLSSSVKDAVARFSEAVGQPKVIEPAGFRDFRGWLAYIGGPSAFRDWDPLVQAVLHDCGEDMRRVHDIKPDLVREIVRAVVIPRDGESSKLVSTNCGRQCARPTSGVTLMTILDRVFNNPRQLKESRECSAVHADKASSLGTRDVSARRTNRISAPSSSRRQLPQSSGGVAAESSAGGRMSASRCSSGSPAHSVPGNSQAADRSGSGGVSAPHAGGSGQAFLPSFRELEDSLHERPHLPKRARN